VRTARVALLPLLLAALTPHVFTQAPAPSPSTGPAFDVVSIKRNTAGTFPVGNTVNQRPDGGFTMTNFPVGAFVARAYPPTIPAEIVGLPAWAMSERYDVRATSSLSRATADDRIAMLRAMLADRFKLALHFEKREQPAYDLVLARSDGKLGAGLTRVEADCDAKIAADRAAADAALADGTPPPPPQRPDFNAPPPPCTLRTVGAFLRNKPDDVLEGETTMGNLATTLRFTTGRFVVNKTGLPGSYRVRMNFDMMAALRGPIVAAPAPDAGASIFSAIQEQLGLKLESSRASRDVLVIDRLERPTDD
jgi:uncharacterized protein (TIGR03435 family)